MPEIMKPGRNNIQPRPAAESLRPHVDGPALSRLLDAWTQGDEQKQRETYEFLREALNEGRRPDCKMFP